MATIARAVIIVSVIEWISARSRGGAVMYIDALVGERG
jgi:hypothetical protein